MRIFFDVKIGENFYLFEFFDFGVGVKTDIDVIANTSCFKNNKSGVFESNGSFDICDQYSANLSGWTKLATSKCILVG
jgi:hypothetical protein